MRDKQDGKLMETQDVVVSNDGETRTLTTKGKNVQGGSMNNLAVSNRQ